MPKIKKPLAAFVLAALLACPALAGNMNSDAPAPPTGPTQPGAATVAGDGPNATVESDDNVATLLLAVADALRTTLTLF